MQRNIKRRRDTLAVVIGFVVVVLTGCDRQPISGAQTDNRIRPAAKDECQQIVHDGGETTICGKPQRVVTVGPHLLEFLLALKVQPVGHAEYFQFVKPVFDHPSQQIPYLGQWLTSQPRNVGTSQEPSLEAIAELKPDLILGDSLKNRDEYARLSQIAPTLLFTYHGSDPAWQSDLQTVAQALRRTDVATTVLANFREQYTKLQQAIAPQVTQYPRVLLLLSQRLDQEIYLETRHSACGNLLEELGFEVVVPDALKQASAPSYTLSLEVLPELDADLIVIAGFNSTVNANDQNPLESQLRDVRYQWQQNPISQSMSASQQGRVYFTTAYLCHALLGPIGTEIFLKQLYQQLTQAATTVSSREH